MLWKKGTNVKVEPTREELERKIQQITQEIREIRERGLQVEIALTIFRAATAALDENMVANIPRSTIVD